MTGVLLAWPADDEHRVHSIFEVGYFAVNPVFAELVAMISLHFISKHQSLLCCTHAVLVIQSSGND